jgi:hypothetical protein
MPTVGGVAGVLVVLLPPPEQATKPIEIELARTSLPTHEKDGALLMLPPEIINFVGLIKDLRTLSTFKQIR